MCRESFRSCYRGVASLLFLFMLGVLAACGGGSSDNSSKNIVQPPPPTTSTMTKTTALQAIADFAQAEEDAYVNLVLMFSDDGTKPIFDSSIALNSYTGQSVNAEIKLVSQTSIAGVSNNPPVKTTFTLSGSTRITKIFTYHWNGGNGATPGTISLKNTGSGTVYGPWTVTGNRTGVDDTVGAVWPTTASGPPYLYWLVQPNATLPAGTYELVDSSQTTWSYTQDTGNKGIASVYGQKLGTATGTTNAAISSSYLKMYELQQKVLDKYDNFEAGMAYLQSQATESTGKAVMSVKVNGKIIDSLYKLVKGFKQSQENAREGIISTYDKLSEAGKTETYNAAVSYFAGRTDVRPGSSRAEFEQKLRSGELDKSAAQLNNELITNYSGGSSSFSDASPENALAKAMVKEGMINISNGVDVIRDTLSLVAPPIGEGMDKSGKFINAVNNPDAVIEKAMRDMVAAKLGLDPEVLSRVPELVKQIKYQTWLFKKRSAAIAEAEALKADGKVVVTGGSSSGTTVSAIDQNGKIFIGANGDTKLLPPGTYTFIITTNDGRTVKVRNVVVTQGKTTTVKIPSTSTGACGESESALKEWGPHHLSYTVSGVSLVTPPAYSAPFGWDIYNYKGTVCPGGTLSVSGNASADNPTSSKDYPYMIQVSVTIGSDTKSFEYSAPVGEKLSKPFSLSVPIPSTATGGSFSIVLTQVNPTYGNRGISVGGSLAK